MPRRKSLRQCTQYHQIPFKDHMHEVRSQWIIDVNQTNRINSMLTKWIHLCIQSILDTFRPVCGMHRPLVWGGHIRKYDNKHDKLWYYHCKCHKSTERERDKGGIDEIEECFKCSPSASVVLFLCTIVLSCTQIACVCVSTLCLIARHSSVGCRETRIYRTIFIVRLWASHSFQSDNSFFYRHHRHNHQIKSNSAATHWRKH